MVNHDIGLFAYLLDSGFGPLGTSCAASLNCWPESEPENVAAAAEVEWDGCNPVVVCEEGMSFLESIGPARREATKRRPRNSNIACDSETTVDLLASAMKLKPVELTNPQ